VSAGRSADARGEHVLFEARLRPRRLLAAVFAALAAAGLRISVGSHNPFIAIGMSGLALFALREWTRFQLRVGDRWLEHLPPHWARTGAATHPLRMAARLVASEVAGLAWNGHDGVGVRMREGRIEVIAVRDRIAETDQPAAREAVLSFVARATGSAPHVEPALDVAPWVVSQ